MPESSLPLLPLLLWETPPGLEMILRQEGIPFRKIQDSEPSVLRYGRFVIHDGRKVDPARVRASLSSEQMTLDLNRLREGEPEDPFDLLIDQESARMTWRVGKWQLTERTHRQARAAIRTRVLGRLRAWLGRHGGLWARLAAYPFPYRSAFNFRADLDEPFPDDYFRFARARRPLADCTTHFVSTHAYQNSPDVLKDLAGLDSQSHGHYHVVYRDEASNRSNLERAHEILTRHGIIPVGFAAPHGRWNPTLDRVLEGLGYLYSSDFQLGRDDFPFFPWRGDRFSTVLQVPIHPVCEGLFFESGLRHPWPVADYLVDVIRAKFEAGEPAFIYGHPERRLARHPEILSAVASAIQGDPLLWRVSLTDFARWWHWRGEQQWSLTCREAGTYEIQFEDWDARYPLGLEIRRGDHLANIPLHRPRETLRLDGLAYERRRLRADLASPVVTRDPWSFRSVVRSMLDWETVTPLDELPQNSFRMLLKKQLRAWKSAGGSR